MPMLCCDRAARRFASARPRWAIGLAVALAAATVSGCFSKSATQDSTIRITGSDTMVNLATAWSETYRQDHAHISSQVRGGGSGVGIAALLNGKVDVATSSRAMNEEELELAEQNTGKQPRQFIVGRDALAIYVHKDNPLAAITLDELAEIYGEGGRITRWEQLGIDNAGCSSGEIVRVSRQNNSGTYEYFREAVLGSDREYKQGSTAQSGSADLVTLIASTPCAIGYSGMGYRTDAVKLLAVARNKGERGVGPTLATALDGSYPISRPLYIYTLGEPEGIVREFVDWVLSPAGQAIVEQVGYVPNPPTAASEPAQPAASGEPPAAPGEK